MKEILKKICAVLELEGGLLDESLSVEFQQNVQNMQDSFAEILEENRVLRLGVVGEVKAGKSSFLNALLFEGEDVLPKAPTPMTAALTRLSYSEHPKTRIVFYSRDDWRGIELMAERYDEKLKNMYAEYCQNLKGRQKARVTEKFQYSGSQPGQQEPNDRATAQQPKSIEDFERLHQEDFPADWKACKEVCHLAQASGVDIYGCLGEEKEIPQEGDGGAYLSRLSDYVGSGGTYTPIVKYTEIQLKNPALKGVEIVDTPGLNDPVISRSKKTREFLMQCDAVFLLSYCGQFLGAEDMEFIMSTLPNEGIKKAVLIGSKMDSAILQYPVRNATFRQAYLGTKRNCERQAESNIADSKKNARGSEVLAQIEKSLPPICTSSLAYSAAVKQKKGQTLNSEETNILKNFHRRFQDFDDSLLLDLSSIGDARREAFEKTVAQKEAILRERTQSFFASQKARFLKDLEEIYSCAAASKSDLENFDCARDSAQLEEMRRGLETARIEVRGAFDSAAVTTRESAKDVELAVAEEMLNHMRIEVHTETKTKHHSSTSGHLFWKHTDHWDEHITIHSAETRDAEANLRGYAVSCLKIINDALRHMIRLEEVKEQVKRAVLKAFDRHNQDFDEQRILVPLDNALRKLVVRDIDLPLGRYVEMLDGQLSGVVTSGVVINDDIPELKRVQDKVLTSMSEDIVQEVRHQREQIVNLLNEQAGLFVDGLVEELETGHKRLEEQIANKQENLERYDKLLQALGEAKKALSQAGAESMLNRGGAV